jgi:1D-myo-inositol-tetrakisphosphate 5-kinase/inositol-polyphosphate multikinase
MAASPGTHVLASQVGGHTGVMSTEDDSLIIKPALARELEFYQKLQQDDSLSALLPYTPKFLGTLKLEGSVDAAQTETLVVQPVADKKDMFRCSLKPKRF